MHTKGYEAHLLQSVYLQHHCHREEWGQYLIFWNNIFFAYGYADPGIQNNSNRNENLDWKYIEMWGMIILLLNLLNIQI